MKKYIIFLAILSILLLAGCEPEQPSAPQLDVRISTLLLSKMVAVGNSLTAGFQSSGLVEDFQLHSYPYLIAQKMGMATQFEQPLIASPGIGSPAGKTPNILPSLSQRNSRRNSARKMPVLEKNR